MVQLVDMFIMQMKINRNGELLVIVINKKLNRKVGIIMID
jgi:hypothetical protein